MHSVTLLTILIALIATVLGQNNTFETTWRCSSVTDAPLDAKQRKEIRNAWGSFLNSRDTTANGTLRVFMSTTYSSDLAATAITNKYQKAALVDTIGNALDYMDSIQTISYFCQQVVNHERPAGAKSAVKMLHLQERLGQSFQLLDSSRETLSSAVQTPIMCVLANELSSMLLHALHFYEISQKSGAPIYQEQLSQLYNQLKSLVYLPTQDIFRSKPRSDL